jgi:hypothetical protein
MSIIEELTEADAPDTDSDAAAPEPSIPLVTVTVFSALVTVALFVGAWVTVPKFARSALPPMTDADTDVEAPLAEIPAEAASPLMLRTVTVLSLVASSFVPVVIRAVFAVVAVWLTAPKVDPKNPVVSIPVEDTDAEAPPEPIRTDAAVPVRSFAVTVLATSVAGFASWLLSKAPVMSVPLAATFCVTVPNVPAVEGELIIVSLTEATAEFAEIPTLAAVPDTFADVIVVSVTTAGPSLLTVSAPPPWLIAPMVTGPKAVESTDDTETPAETPVAEAETPAPAPDTSPVVSVVS